jgi:hypothetical protein
MPLRDGLENGRTSDSAARLHVAASSRSVDKAWAGCHGLMAGLLVSVHEDERDPEAALHAAP